MSEPTANDVDLDARLEQVNRGGMPKDVRGDSGSWRGRLRGVEPSGSPAHDLVDAETSQRLSGARGEDRRRAIVGLARGDQRAA